MYKRRVNTRERKELNFRLNDKNGHREARSGNRRQSPVVSEVREQPFPGAAQIITKSSSRMEFLQFVEGTREFPCIPVLPYLFKVFLLGDGMCMCLSVCECFN